MTNCPQGHSGTSTGGSLGIPDVARYDRLSGPTGAALVERPRSVGAGLFLAGDADVDVLLAAGVEAGESFFGAVTEAGAAADRWAFDSDAAPKADRAAAEAGAGVLDRVRHTGAGAILGRDRAVALDVEGNRGRRHEPLGVLAVADRQADQCRPSGIGMATADLRRGDRGHAETEQSLQDRPPRARLGHHPRHIVKFPSVHYRFLPYSVQPISVARSRERALPILGAGAPAVI